MAAKDKIGMDGELIDSADWELACRRVENDQKSDFIFAPHLQYIFEHGKTALIETTKADLKGGNFIAQPPMHIEVPKSSRFKGIHTSRSGPNFSRRGSILLPKDRLLYQMLADQVADAVEENTDRKRCFSNQLNDIEPDTFFFQQGILGGTSKEKLENSLKIKTIDLF